jgi:hypothetical protein
MKLFKLITAGTLLLQASLSLAQTATGTNTVIQQPCNGNGILAVNITSGMTPPLNFYYMTAFGSSTLHSNINSMNDTLFAISTAISYVYVTDGLGAAYYYASTSMVPPFTLDPEIVTDAICPSLTGTLQLTINGGTAPVSVDWYEYVFATGTGIGPFAGSGNPVTLPAGQYVAVVTDASGCTVSTGLDSTSGYHIDNISGINFNVFASIANCTDGIASALGLTGGTPPYTYSWNTGATTSSISGLSQGGYTCRVTDAQGCYEERFDYVAQGIYIPVNPVVTSATCLQNDGAVISFASGGVPPYTYVYSNGFTGQSVSGLSGNTYLTVTATDANGCVGSEGININSTTPIIVSYSSINSSCTAPTGSITLAVMGGTPPYSVNWTGMPALSGITVTGLPAGSYPFSVTDAAGCVQTGTAVISPANIINALVNNVSPVCPVTTGSISLNVTGSDPPFTYMWNTGATTSSITGVPVGSYSCIITDNSGCTLTKHAGLISTSPLSVSLAGTQASCLYLNDGSIYANVTGGTPPYSFHWNNGQTTQTATGLGTGMYYVYATDANGCSSYGYHTFLGYDASNSSCYCTITGKIYTDLNSNCSLDAGEQGIEHIQVHCSGYGYTFTDANGNYSFMVPSGTYIISEMIQAIYPLAPCQSNNLSVTVTAGTGGSTTVNFANNVIPLHDIHIVHTSLVPAVPGNNTTQMLILQNDGTLNEANIQLGKRDDGQLDLISTSPVTYTQASPVTEPNWYSITSGFPSLAPGASLSVYSTYYVPTSVPLATVVNFKDTAVDAAPIAGWVSDYTPWNNIEQYQTTVIGSYDPNFKEVSPAGTGPEGFIETSDSVLDYIVHFQNTGSYYAEKVVVIDTLDSDLDWETLRPGYSDHSYTVSLTESGVLTFTFDNIHLDWEANNYLASCGLFTYAIKQKPNLAPGTEIRNSAAIYFDYNAPVITNRTLNTIRIPAGINDTDMSSNINIYPNPASMELNVDLSNAENVISISLLDVQGRQISRNMVSRGTAIQKLDITSIKNGFYFVRIEKTDGTMLTKKFIKN